MIYVKILNNYVSNYCLFPHTVNKNNKNIFIKK